MIAVDQAKVRAFGNEEGDSGVKCADDEVDGEMMVKVLRGPELLAYRLSQGAERRRTTNEGLTIQLQ